MNQFLAITVHHLLIYLMIVLWAFTHPPHQLEIRTPWIGFGRTLPKKCGIDERITPMYKHSLLDYGSLFRLSSKHLYQSFLTFCLGQTLQEFPQGASLLFVSAMQH